MRTFIRASNLAWLFALVSIASFASAPAVAGPRATSPSSGQPVRTLVIPSVARTPLILRKTLVQSGDIKKSNVPSGNFAIGAPQPLNCDVGRGLCTYELIATVDVSNNLAANGLALGLLVDGVNSHGTTGILFATTLPSDGSFNRYTIDEHRKNVKRGNHTVQVLLFTGFGLLSIRQIDFTYHLYTAK